jgi:adenosylcobinamide-GDP ribazoletransferase
MAGGAHRRAWDQHCFSDAAPAPWPPPGCLHEDGLADTADSFGGATRERKLEIMRDSRIGSYALCALVMSLLLRVGALASLADPALVAPALIAAHAAARATMPALMFFVPPARSDGLSFQAGRPSSERVAAAVGLGVLFLAGSLGLRLALEAAIVTALFARQSLKQIGGQTGDVVGALEQVSEVAVLLVALR